MNKEVYLTTGALQEGCHGLSSMLGVDPIIGLALARHRHLRTNSATAT